MTKQVLTATSFLLGGAGVILVAHLAANPMAFTHPVVETPALAPVSAHASGAVAGATEGDGSVVLPEITIVASVDRASQAMAPTAALDACSRWGEVGALFIEPSGATGVRSVRRLCPAVR